MNRADFKAKLQERIPIIVESDRKYRQESEVLRHKFVKDYPVERISKLELDEYVIGKGSSNYSYCYRVERELDCLGRILGTPAIKFGIWYGRIRSDKEHKYRFAKNQKRRLSLPVSVLIWGMPGYMNQSNRF